MENRYSGLVILNISKVCEGSKSHNEFSEFAAAGMLAYMQYIADMAENSDDCVPCSLLSMTSTLISNIFLLYEDRTNNSPESLTEVFINMVEAAKKTAEEHKKKVEQASKAENKLNGIYSARKP